MSSFFPTSDMDELGRVLGKFSVRHQFVNAFVLDAEDVDIEKAFKRENPVLLYRLLKLYAHDKISEGTYLEDLHRVLVAAKLPEGRIRLECFDMNSKRGYSAKDIEVALGKRLEKEGYAVTLEDPAVLAYLVIVDMHCYVGFVPYDPALFLNPVRHYQALATGISRAELKLIEAFDEFRIKTGGGVAIDLGAAPGGWSAYLARKDFKVVAVDNGALNYEKLSAMGLTVKSIDNTSEVGGFVGRYDILHVRSNFQNVAATLRDVDLIASDMNIEAGEAIQAVLQFSDCLKKGAALIITIKCITRALSKIIKKSEELLGKEYEIVGVRTLPSNRQETTLYALKK